MPAVRYWGRRAVPAVVLLLLAPVAITGLYHAGDAGASGTDDATVTAENLTVVASQGAGPRGDGLGDGVLEGVRTDDGSVAWVHDEYERYYDVDPVDDETLLFVAHDRTDGDVTRAYAVEWNRVTNETERRFAIPRDTHDVDRLGPHEYVVADKVDDRAFVYNYTADDEPKRSTDEVVWQYRFGDHFGPPGVDGVEGDYTHLNDVDAVDDGETFVLDPRNFNRVIAVDRSTKEIEWTLGEQDDRSILFRQHDPVVIEREPLTVLVGDSRNNRVVEYRRVDGRWERTWAFGEGLNWPRDADRLPNGNTLVTDTGNDRVVEISPDGTVVWQYETTDPNPYDVERVHLGDEPTGPTMATIRDENESVAAVASDPSIDRSPSKFVYRTGSWVLPVWVGPLEFAALALSAVAIVGWLAFESGVWVRAALRARG